jgi:hypothetical protein
MFGTYILARYPDYVEVAERWGQHNIMQHLAHIVRATFAKTTVATAVCYP